MSASESPAGSIRCPKCRTRFRLAEDAQVGAKIHCPSCSAKIRLGLESLQGRMVAGHLVGPRVGKGAMGAVFKLQGADPEEPVKRAIKFMAPELRDDAEMLGRFRRESALCTRLRHPHLVRVYEGGDYQGIPFMVMGLIEGVSLDRILDKSGAMDWRKASEVTLQVAEVLAYLHREGVVHRDVKPENILIDGRRQVTLIDLGFAKVLNEPDNHAGSATESGNQLTMAGTALGSPAYMAPEQILDAMSATAATDCYCLGASFYHMVSGKLPYDGNNAMVAMQAVLAGGCPTVRSLRPQLPVGVDRLIGWMMASKVDQRPESLEQVVTALRSLLANPNDLSALPKVRQSGGGLLALVIIVGVVIVALAAWWLWPTPSLG